MCGRGTELSAESRGVVCFGIEAATGIASPLSILTVLAVIVLKHNAGMGAWR
jgi:hypothetical protein